MIRHLAWIAVLCLWVQSVSAQGSRFKVFKEDSDKRAQIRNTRPLTVYYEKVSWNQNPTQVETGYLYLRNKVTGDLIEMRMAETEPNSGVFTMEYPVGTIRERSISAEVYSAPQSMLEGDDRVSVIQKLIEDGSVKRKPFLLRVLRSRGQVIDVFDDKKEALAAYNNYRKQMGLTPEGLESESIIEVANKEKPEQKKVIDTSTLQSLFMANENDLAATNEKNKELREVLKSMEEKRRNKVKSDARGWTASQAKTNKNKAGQLTKNAMADIKASRLSQSVDNFFKASDLVPTQEDVYEQYGVSLFRDNKFNQSIVVLELSAPSKERLAEKDFYLGMNYFKLKDYAKTVEHFDKVVQSGDQSFGPTAAFYKGSSLIEIGEFDKAKESFQYVLDNSKNPEMDKRAEKFIEYSLDRKALEEKRSNWFFLDGVLGLIYDSNIILAADQARDQGTVTDEEGWRLLASVSPKFRPYYSSSDEIKVKLDLTTLKSFDEGFGSNPVAETADPLLIGVSVPWTHRGTLGGKGYFFDLAPGYDTIIMDLDGTGNATITNSYKLNFNNTLVINKNWIAKGDYSFASNDSNILGDEESADSFSAGIKLSSIFILNKDLERYLIPEFGYQINDAKATTYAFSRVDLGLTFTTATFWSMMWNSRAAYYLANYESNRTDNNYTISTGVSRRISSRWNWGLMGSYIVNDSTTNRYNKYNVVTTFSFSY